MPPTPAGSGSFQRLLEETVGAQAAELVGQERGPLGRSQNDRVVEEPGDGRAAEPATAASGDQVLLAARTHRDALEMVRAPPAMQIDLGAERRPQPPGHEARLVLGSADVD